MSHKENELAFWGGVWQSRLGARLCMGRRMLRPLTGSEGGLVSVLCVEKP